MDLEPFFFYFFVGVWMGGQDKVNFLYRSKDAPENSTDFDINVVEAAGVISFRMENWKFSGFKLRGLMWNQISTP